MSAVAENRLPESWRVRLPVFEGPLDLLLHLVRINEVDVYDIPVARICDQFHEYLGLMEELNLDIAAEYVYEAALLIHLKSRMLLPRTPVAESEGDDPRLELVERLLEYRRIKEASQSLAEIHGVRLGVWTRPPQPLDTSGADEDADPGVDLEEVSLFDLLASLKKVLQRYDREHPPAFHVKTEVFSVRDQFTRMLAALDGGRPHDLLEDLRGRSCRAEAVAAFLAVLELARLNLVRVHQGEKGDLLLFRTARVATVEELESVPA